MTIKKYTYLLIIGIGCFALSSNAQQRISKPVNDAMRQAFLQPTGNAKPWVFWYWMQGAVTREGISADLQAMRQAGIGGAYLMPIKGPANPPFVAQPVVQLTPLWWQMVKFAMEEAKRNGLKLGMHVSDGFALAGGPWITPESSMQKVVWSQVNIAGGQTYRDTLPPPAHYKNYYKDIKVLAYPARPGTGVNSYTERPVVTTDLPDTDVKYLAEKGNQKVFSTNDECWLQYEFAAPFTCRSIVVHTKGSNYQAQRLKIEVSIDGKNFRSIGRLFPPRHGWQDYDYEITHSIVPVNAKYFRFFYKKEGTEPGAEDLDYAKWKPTLKITGIELSATPRIHQYESKNGSAWRVSRRTSAQKLPAELCIPKEKIIDITDKLGADGKLNWQAPTGTQWTVLRIGHTSTGHTNATGGGGIGLECDKFSEEAATLQFNSWFGEAVKQAGPQLAKEVLQLFHIDSWECGSQNWSATFAAEFKKRRGYDVLPYLPVMAGVPVESAETSEKVLSDVRETIVELVKDKFFTTMAKPAHDKGCTFSAESVAPTMLSDGLLHYSTSDIPMGEFWFRSPTHDKPNDMLDAISGGHIYGKNIIQAECFTQLRIFWDEHPAMFKTMADRNFALGINKLVFHVNVHNPFTDRKPGITLDGIGVYFQRDQTWWKPGRAWFDYVSRCQTLLQQGRPVADIAVFTGEEATRRSVLPDRLVKTLPGIFGKHRVESEAKRLANKGEPLDNDPADASHSANMALPEQWIDPLRGYAYDSFNKDALLNLATVKNGRIVLPGGASYAMLVIPANHALSPDAGLMSLAVVKKLQQLVDDGANVLLCEAPARSPGRGEDSEVATAGKKLMESSGKGRVIKGPYIDDTFDGLGIGRDAIFTENNAPAKGIAWTHRDAGDKQIYFIANQIEQVRSLNVSLRTTGNSVELWDALTGEVSSAASQLQNNRTVVPVKLAANGSVFIVIHKSKTAAARQVLAAGKVARQLSEKWTVKFDTAYGGPEKPAVFDGLKDWSASDDPQIKYYSGTAIYTQSFKWAGGKARAWLDVGKVNNLAEVYVNGINCGVAWTYPYRVEITKALKRGKNQLKIAVTNTWANRIMGDQLLPQDKRLTWTNAPFRLEGRQLLPAGLLGPVTIVK